VSAPTLHGFALLSDSTRRGGVRVARVQFVAIYDFATIAREPASDRQHVLPLDRVCSMKRRATLRGKLLALLAAGREQLQLLAPAEKSAVNQTLAGAGASELENAA